MTAIFERSCSLYNEIAAGNQYVNQDNVRGPSGSSKSEEIREICHLLKFSILRIYIMTLSVNNHSAMVTDTSRSVFMFWNTNFDNGTSCVCAVEHTDTHTHTRTKTHTRTFKYAQEHTLTHSIHTLHIETNRHE